MPACPSPATPNSSPTRTGTPRVVMMLATPGLRVALATTHLPLREVPRPHHGANRWKGAAHPARATCAARSASREPRILVAGLNPHAGEGGHLGREEIDVIDPVLAAPARRRHAT